MTPGRPACPAADATKADRRQRGVTGGYKMDRTTDAWQHEIERRARHYDDLDARGAWEGRMGATDYVGLLVLTVALVVGFWAWGH